MNKNIKKMIVAVSALTLIIGATFVSFANDKLEPEVIKINAPTLYNSESNESEEEATPILISSEVSEYMNILNDDFEVSIASEKVEFDVSPIVKEGKLMIPLSALLAKMDYKYEWKEDSSSIDIMKGAQFTTIYIGKNEYFKNKMAARALSTSPVIVDGRTLVPVEFFNEILGLNISVSENSIEFSEGEMALHSGYITDIKKDEEGNSTITISKKKDSEDMMDLVIIHTKKGQTVFNNSSIVVGEFINVISPMMMTMSIPAQTSGIVIY